MKSELADVGDSIVEIEPRFRLIPFEEMQPATDPEYLVHGLFPRGGLVVVWGPPKCGKSFWTMDVMLHIALGWVYRGRRVQQGPIVYCAFEGQAGYGKRAEAFRQRFLAESASPVPFYLVAAPMNFIADHGELIGAIRLHLRSDNPVGVVLDTLNRSLVGSENDDEDIGAYIKAADAVRTAFNCMVVIVHHCGVEGTRPRGHTSLGGALDAQIAARRDAGGNVVAEVEWMKDGEEGNTVASRLEVVDVGLDDDGQPITSCVVVPIDEPTSSSSAEPRLTKNQKTHFAILFEAGAAGLTLEEWNQKARDAGIGVTRKADLYDLRSSLLSKKLVREIGERWAIMPAFSPDG
jgi:AAA domain